MNWDLVAKLIDIIHAVSGIPQLKKLGDMAHEELQGMLPQEQVAQLEEKDDPYKAPEASPETPVKEVKEEPKAEESVKFPPYIAKDDQGVAISPPKEEFKRV